MEQEPSSPQEAEQHKTEVEQQIDSDRTREFEPETDTRIYVASLSDYNDGRLHGVHLDASLDTEKLERGVREMLARSPMPGAEEWAIHDYEGFGPLRLGEYESLAAVAEIGQGIATHGPAFAHWAALCDNLDHDELARFEDVFLGHWDSVEAYGESLLEDFGVDHLIEKSIPEHLQPYVKVDVEGFGRDLEYSGDVTSSEGDGGVYLFDQNR